MSEHVAAVDLLAQGTGLLNTTHLRELGLERRAIDAVLCECPVIQLPGYSRPLLRVEAYLALLEGSTYCDRSGDRVRRGWACRITITRCAQSKRRDEPAQTVPAPTTTDTNRGRRSCTAT